MFCSTNSKYICLYLSVDDALQCFSSAAAQNTNRIETNASLIFWGNLGTSTFPRSLASLYTNTMYEYFRRRFNGNKSIYVLDEHRLQFFEVDVCNV